MKLIQQTPVTTYKMYATYTKISKESPLISILKICKEIDVFNDSQLQDFLKPLNKNAISNILVRLENLDYLNNIKEDFWTTSHNEKSYELTQKGIDACLNEEIEEENEGIIAMTVAYPINTDPIVVKIDPLCKNEFHHEENTKKDAKIKFNDFINQSQFLRNGTFKVKHIKDTYVVGENTEQDYVFNFSDDSYTSQLLDFSKRVEVPKQEVIAELLANEFKSAYDEKQHLIRVSFNNKDLSLKRHISIENPIYDGLNFRKIDLQTPVQISPSNLQEAEQWFTALVISRIQNYFFSDEEFNRHTKKIAREFVEYQQSLISVLSRSQLINKLNKMPEYFYINAKLDTINYLNY